MKSEYLVLYAVDDIYVPEYHHVVGGRFVDVSGISQYQYSGQRNLKQYHRAAH